MNRQDLKITFYMLNWSSNKENIQTKKKKDTKQNKTQNVLWFIATIIYF